MFVPVFMVTVVVVLCCRSTVRRSSACGSSWRSPVTPRSSAAASCTCRRPSASTWPRSATWRSRSTPTSGWAPSPPTMVSLFSCGRIARSLLQDVCGCGGALLAGGLHLVLFALCPPCISTLSAGWAERRRAVGHEPEAAEPTQPGEDRPADEEWGAQHPHQVSQHTAQKHTERYWAVYQVKLEIIIHQN